MGEIAKIMLVNDWLCVELSQIGASLMSLKVLELDRDIVLGFDYPHDYHNNPYYFGSMIGRCTNRIAQGIFSLQNNTYYLDRNDGINHLHGGFNGFSKKIFDYQSTENQVVFTTVSEANEEGYPGRCEIWITYTLRKNQLILDYEAICDEDTLFNPTNHSYFNCAGHQNGTILDHTLQVNADKFYPIDDQFCTLPISIDVKDTPLDFREPQLIQKVVESEYPQIKIATGIDHHFDIPNDHLRFAVEFAAKQCVLKVYTDSPGVHIYTGHFIAKNTLGKAKAIYEPFSGCCFETQYVPNSINFDPTIAPILKANQRFKSTTIYEINTRSEYGK